MTMHSIRPLHLHSVESLCADLIRSRPIGVGEKNLPFLLETEAARSILNWYRTHRAKWAGNVLSQDVDAIVDSVETPQEFGSDEPVSSSEISKRLSLRSVRAHQFGGLHVRATDTQSPAEFNFEFKDGVTLFEGFNGSGKTSILNALIWALTGEMLRPQRPPELSSNDVIVQIDGLDDHSMRPVMPLPDPALYRLGQHPQHVDTFVELVFENDAGQQHVLRRSLRRNKRNVFEESVTGLEALGLDPIGTRVGTVMPGMLPFVQLGLESKLGKAVAELTGMAPLVALAGHADRVKTRIQTELTKTQSQKIKDSDTAFGQSRTELLEKLNQRKSFVLPVDLPLPSNDLEIEPTIGKVIAHLEALKSKALTKANEFLGSNFNAEDPSQREDLERKVFPAMTAIANISKLPSTSRLATLSKIAEHDLVKAEELMEKISLEAAAQLLTIAKPSQAGRNRLYVRVASWKNQHPELVESDEKCVVCGSDIQSAIDPNTGMAVKTHLLEAGKPQSEHLGKTLAIWAQDALARLSHDLPEELAREMKKQLPNHPGDLIHDGLTVELFENNSFGNTLESLKECFVKTCVEGIRLFPGYEFIEPQPIGSGQSELEQLNLSINRVKTAIAFAKWRRTHKNVVATFVQSVVGLSPKDDRQTATSSLLGKLQSLKKIVDGMEPLNHALLLCSRMKKEVEKRRLAEKRIASYTVAIQGLSECGRLGEIAEKQVAGLQQLLHKKAVKWRNRIYIGAFPSSNVDLVETKMNGAGALQLLVGSGGLAAPAQHVSNASALRASLVGFYLAYWEHMLKERGGLRILLLDDPQELLDSDNRERLADSVKELIGAGAQLILTTHDARFANALAKRAKQDQIGINHQAIHPISRQRGTLYVSPSVATINTAREAFLSDADDPSKAQDYASESRLFIEGRLGDFFDGPVFPSASSGNFAPTLSDHLNRLRGLQRNGGNELSSSGVLAKLCQDPALNPSAPTFILLNKSHHSKSNIRPAEVNAVEKDLERLCGAIERIHQDFRLYLRREPLVTPLVNQTPITTKPVPHFCVPILPNLVAFVRGSSEGESQETEFEEIGSHWFEGKTFFHLRTNNMGFAGPTASIAIVEVEPNVGDDHRLVIARQGRDVYARRALRSTGSPWITLSAEKPDPRKNPPPLHLHENEVHLHRVVGMIFGPNNTAPPSKAEAVQVDWPMQLQQVKSAYRIKEESAIPLALPDQIALGGSPLSLADFDLYLERHVALHLEDGSCIFKRVGARLPRPLGHLRQFESIGGLGVAEIIAVDGPQQGFQMVEKAVPVLGVLYEKG